MNYFCDSAGREWNGLSSISSWTEHLFLRSNWISISNFRRDRFSEEIQVGGLAVVEQFEQPFSFRHFPPAFPVHRSSFSFSVSEIVFITNVLVVVLLLLSLFYFLYNSNYLFYLAFILLFILFIIELIINWIDFLTYLSFILFIIYLIDYLIDYLFYLFNCLFI